MIDLHTHTTYSDGADDPSTLLQHASNLGLTYLSITDHNSVSAYRDQAIARWHDLYGGILIPGIEITCMYAGEVVEVLGYGYDLDMMESQLSNNVLTFEHKQLAEARLIFAAFEEAGITVDAGEISFDPKHESSRKSFFSLIKRNPANRRLLSNSASWESSRIFTREEIYNPESKLYVNESSLYPTVSKASGMIHAARGIAFLAHLYIYASARHIRKNLVTFVREASLDGVECTHSAFNDVQIHDLESFTTAQNLLKSGGSDYHGSRKPDISLGRGRGRLSVPESYLEGWPFSALEAF